MRADRHPKQLNRIAHLCAPPSIHRSAHLKYDKMAENRELFTLDIIKAHTSTLAEESLNTLPIETPPRSSTPPPLSIDKRKSERKTAEENGGRSDRQKGVELIDPNVLSKALLKEFDDAGKHMDITPSGSPSRKRQRTYGVYGDR